MARVAGAMITYNDARLMVSSEGYTQKKTIPVSTQAMSKSKIEEYLNANISGTYASNQLVPYNRISKSGGGGQTTKSFLISTLGGISASLACSRSVDITRYFVGSGFLYPQIGDVVYNDTNGTILFSGLDQFYKLSSNQLIKINDSGIVTEYELCNPQ